MRGGDWKFLLGVDGVEGRIRISSSSAAAAPLVLPLVRPVSDARTGAPTCV